MAGWTRTSAPTNDPRSGDCKRDSTEWWPGSPSGTGYVTCSDATSGPTSHSAPSNEGASLSGDVVEAAVLFIDLVESTRLAESRPPQEVAEVLNDFFRIVVERRRRTPTAWSTNSPAMPRSPSSGCRCRPTSRHRRRWRPPVHSATQLRRLPGSISVSASRRGVFAGNVGAENRYEYTVIGDAVNEAARLADLAKTSDRRILCSAGAIDAAGEAERAQWAECYSTVLRGRSEATHVSAPTGSAG